MKISTILDHIDSGHMALPEFQWGYVWNRDQVKGLFDSLYHKHPVGGLLVWATESKTAAHRGDGPLVAGVVKLLLDGQQRMTSLYGVVRGKPPKFFDGNALAFTGLRFHLESQTFAFYQPMKMHDDPLWIDVTQLMQQGNAGLGTLIGALGQSPNIGEYVGRLSRLLAILDRELYIDEVTGPDKTLDIVVEIFNKVNSGGTKLSKGDLALAKICSDWPEARGEMKKHLKHWADDGFVFSLDWLLRGMNTVLTGEAKFSFLHEQGATEVQDALSRASKQIGSVLDLISGRLGLDHDAVLFGRYAIPVMVRYLDQHPGQLSATERDKLLFWFAQAGMWGRFSGSTESVLDQDLAALAGTGDPLDALLTQLRLWHGGLTVEPGHFQGWSLGARFYPVLYMLTRMGLAQDWGSGLPLKATMLGNLSRLEQHHIFPKAQLYKQGYRKSEVNALANFCLQTQLTNLWITDKLPANYFPEVEKNHPGALASQWIPLDPELWKIENYREFLQARRVLLAEEANARLAELLHGDTHWLHGSAPSAASTTTPVVLGGITSEDEEAELVALSEWVEAQSLPHGILSYELTDPETGEQTAVFDLAWPEGLQEGLSQPVAVLLQEEAETLALASGAGFRCFTDTVTFQAYVRRDVLGEEML
jgi:hypothetical protein